MARDYAKEYARRIKNAAKKGVSKQQARGHKKAEHIARKDREIEERGLSSQQEKTIEGWYGRTYNPADYNEAARADLDEVIEFVRSNGYDAFTQWRNLWDEIRREYLRQVREGEYDKAVGIVSLEYMAAASGVSDVSWLYYH